MFWNRKPKTMKPVSILKAEQNMEELRKLRAVPKDPTVNGQGISQARMALLEGAGRKATA